MRVTVPASSATKYTSIIEIIEQLSLPFHPCLMMVVPLSFKHLSFQSAYGILGVRSSRTRFNYASTYISQLIECHYLSKWSPFYFSIVGVFVKKQNRSPCTVYNLIFIRMCTNYVLYKVGNIWKWDNTVM